MKGKCKYCGKELQDKSNIRCDTCDYAFSEGQDLGEEYIKSKIKESLKFLISLGKD